MSDDKPRVHTQAEMQDMIMEHLWVMVDYWDKAQTNEGPKTQRDRLEGLAFSVLSMLDGASMDIPAITLLPDPHDEDKAYCQEQGANWWPAESDGTAITGGDWPQLHEYWHKYGREHKHLKE